MQPVPRLIDEPSRFQLHGTLLVRAVSVMIALCGLLLNTSSAFARQIAQAHWIALETRELDQDLPGGPLPTGFVGVDRGLSSADGCGVDYCESSFGRSETTMAFHITGENIAFEWVVQCVADFEAVTLERLGGELTMYVELGGKWQSLEEGDTVTIEPGETALILVISSTPSAKVNLDAQLSIVEGSLASVEAVYGYWQGTSDSWTCGGAADWAIGTEDISCPNVAYPQCPTGLADFSASATMNQIDLQLSASEPNSITVQCEFLLRSDCCVAYHQLGGPYCDGFATIDGALLPRPSGAASCDGHEGLVSLSAGWHTLRQREWDSGSGVTNLYFTAGDCGPDCNNNGQPDSVEIAWALLYDNVDLDSDDDAQLDSCERAAGDLNLDGSVGSADLAIMLHNWGGGSIGDINADGNVNAVDLGILLAGWSRS